MTRRLTPRTLAVLATDVATAHILSAVEKVVEGLENGIDSLPDDHNPFARCTAAVLENILDYLQKQRGPRNLNCLQFEILLCHSVRRLDLFLTSEFLSRKEAHRFQRMFRRISRYGDQLSELSLEFYLSCDNEELCRMLAALPKLRSFLVAFENLSDKVLEALGNHCPELQKLVLCETPQITDSGLRCLVNEAGTKGCRGLTFLSIEGAPPGVTVKSAVYLLERLPALEALHLPSLDKALVVLNEIKPPDFKLGLAQYKDLNILAVQTSVRPTMREFLTKMIDLCPRLHSVDIEIKTTDDISPLRLLTNMTELSIRTTESTSEWFFYTQLEPVLQEAGSALTSLKLAMPDVDLSAIDCACRNLQSLQLVALSMCWKRNNVKLSEAPFSKLESLFLDPESPQSLKTRDLALLFNNSYELRELVIGSCDTFDDIFLMDTIQRGLLRNLKRVELHYLRKLTILGLQQLVLLDDHLEFLALKDCNGLSNDDIAYLRDSASLLKYELKVQM